MSDSIFESATSPQVVASGQGMAVPEVLRKLTAIVAAEGDVKLVAEVLQLDEWELRSAWLQNPDQALMLVRSGALLTILQMVAEVKSAIIADVEHVTQTQVKLLQVLLDALGMQQGITLFQQNNTQNNLNETDAVMRLADRMGLLKGSEPSP